ncbi:hypothetical protein LC607_14360 [Nostoc sp. CHAB 5824]|nr:hypothetical protein [Nostoc sp. CHAB 5824]
MLFYTNKKYQLKRRKYENKKQLIEEIESAPDALLTERLNFLRFLKTKQTQVQPTQHQVEFASHTTVNSTGSSLLEHLKTIGTWQLIDMATRYQRQQSNLAFRTYANNSRNPYSQVGAIHELPLQRVLLRKS